MKRVLSLLQVNIIHADSKKEFFYKLIQLGHVDSDLIIDIFDEMYSLTLHDQLKELEELKNIPNLTLSPSHHNIYGKYSDIKLYSKDQENRIYPSFFCFSNPEEKIQYIQFPFDTIWSSMKQILKDSNDPEFGSGGYAPRKTYYTIQETNLYF